MMLVHPNDDKHPIGLMVQYLQRNKALSIADLASKAGRGSKLRWDVDLVKEVIRREMLSNLDQQHRAYCESR